MAGVGEASAIVGLIATAAQLSKAVIDIAGRYKSAKKQIEAFGLEVGNLGSILDQLHRLYDRDNLDADDGVRAVALQMVEQCGGLFSELEDYRNTLYSRPGSVQNVKFRGKTKWVFEAAELQYLRARVESMKSNMLLMMMMQCMQSLQRPMNDPISQENGRQLQLLSLQSNACVQRLEHLETEMILPGCNGGDPAVNRMSIRSVESADEARSNRDSILSLFGHLSYYEKILDRREGDFAMAPDIEADVSRLSMIIENHLSQNVVIGVGEDPNVPQEHSDEEGAKTPTDYLPDSSHTYGNMAHARLPLPDSGNRIVELRSTDGEQPSTTFKKRYEDPLFAHPLFGRPFKIPKFGKHIDHPAILPAEDDGSLTRVPEDRETLLQFAGVRKEEEAVSQEAEGRENFATTNNKLRSGKDAAEPSLSIIFLAASICKYHIDRSRKEAGYPYLSYVRGEIFDVLGVKGELWLARNQEEPNRIGWIWSLHLAKLAKPESPKSVASQPWPDEEEIWNEYDEFLDNVEPLLAPPAGPYPYDRALNYHGKM